MFLSVTRLFFFLRIPRDFFFLYTERTFFFPTVYTEGIRTNLFFFSQWLRSQASQPRDEGRRLVVTQRTTQHTLTSDWRVRRLRTTLLPATPIATALPDARSKFSLSLSYRFCLHFSLRFSICLRLSTFFITVLPTVIVLSSCYQRSPCYCYRLITVLPTVTWLPLSTVTVLVLSVTLSPCYRHLSTLTSRLITVLLPLITVFNGPLLNDT